ncbi:enoyl-CoA hydratase/isomerase family protein [Microbaculum marinum]|uniref:Enoyl-CoA hydratase/isomerase family protein n=1 Tax=Microbaculum marinum TaxID=1764581 RepID=A0AAW9RI54_9HYPH
MIEGATNSGGEGDNRVLFDVSDGVARITLNRPEKLNPLDRKTVSELRAIVERLEDDETVRVVVIAGSGKAFSAGGDLEGYLGLYRDPTAFQRFLDDFQALNGQIEDSGKIYIAEVNGICVAGGLELILACDVVVAAEDARIGDCHVNFGQLPGAGSSQRLPRVVGPLRAKSLIYSGRTITGAQAEAIGLATMAVPADKLAETTRDLIDRYLACSPVGLRGAKYLINEGLKGSLEAGLDFEKAFVHRYATTEPDATEGLVAFAEKRRPNFRMSDQERG